MKKSLSILLAFAMVLTMFASVSFAADELTAQEKFDALAAKGIFTGLDEAGTPGLDQDMTRAQFARVAGLLMGLDFTNPPATATFSDVPTTHWAFEEVEAGVAAGLFVGIGDGKFGDKLNVTIEQIAVVLVEAFNLEVDEDAVVEGAHDWAAKYVKAALENGLIPEVSDYTANATRSQLVVSSYAAAQQAGIIVPETVTATAAQTGASTITVSFNKAVSAADQADLDIEVKNGFVPYAVEATWAEDGKSVALKNNYPYPAGDYDVTVGDQEAISVKVVAQQVVKVEIGAVNLQVADDQDLKVKAINQFGEEVTTANLTVSVYVGSTAVTPDADNKVDLATFKIDDVVVVTAIDPSNGISANKTYKLVAASTVTSMQFGPVVPKKDKSVITTGEEDVEIPYTLIDQYGSKINLSGATTNVNASTNIIGDIYFTTGDAAIVDTASFVVNDKGVLKFKAGTKAGTVVITAYNTKSGAATSFQIKVDNPPTVKTFTLQHPGVLLVQGEAVKFPFLALDQFQKPIDTKDFAKAATSAGITFTSSNSVNVPFTQEFDAKTGELSLTFTGNGNTTIYAWIDGQIASQVNVKVEKPAELKRISGIVDVQRIFAPGGQFTIEAKHVNVLDNYGRVKLAKDAGNPAFTVTVKDNSTNVVSVTGTTITGQSTEGTKTIVLSLGDAETNYEFTVTSVKASAVVSYEMNDLGTIYGSVDSKYAKSIKLTGKDSAGNVVAIDQDAIVTKYTSSNDAVASVSVSGDVYGVVDVNGEATIAVWQNATKLAEKTVTVSKAAPVATTVTIKNDGDIVFANETTTTVTVTVKDQYGVAVTPAGGYTTSDEDTAGVTAGTVTFKKAGTVTIGYITDNGVAATVEVTAY